jgi:hypothetical protein
MHFLVKKTVIPGSENYLIGKERDFTEIAAKVKG